MFNPLDIEPIILSASGDIASVSMNFINVTDSSSIRGASSLFNVGNYGSFSISIAKFTNINQAAAEYDING